MGVLVHPSYQDEKVNGVAVSFDLIAGRFDYYYVNSQAGRTWSRIPTRYRSQRKSCWTSMAAPFF